jgi:hypothetical protein
MIFFFALAINWHFPGPGHLRTLGHLLILESFAEAFNYLLSNHPPQFLIAFSQIHASWLIKALDRLRQTNITVADVTWDKMQNAGYPRCGRGKRNLLRLPDSDTIKN